MKRSTSKDEAQKAQRQVTLVQAHRDYIARASGFIQKSEATLAAAVGARRVVDMGKVLSIQCFIAHGQRQIDPIERRVVYGEKIPHEEKVFSVFQPHTEWISKGKAGVPVELGLKVCVVEDTQGYLLHHPVMERQTDDQIAIDLIEQTQKKYPALAVCRFDKGFHSPRNQIERAKTLDRVVLPKIRSLQ